jgi:integrase
VPAATSRTTVLLPLIPQLNPRLMVEKVLKASPPAKPPAIGMICRMSSFGVKLVAGRFKQIRSAMPISIAFSRTPASTRDFSAFHPKGVQSGYTGDDMATRQIIARRQFTATLLRSLPPGRHKDPGQRGLYLLVRKRADGDLARSWLHRVKVRGGDTYSVIGHFPETGLEAARNAIREQLEQLSKGIDPRAAAPRRRAFRSPRSLSSAAVASAHSMEHLVGEFVHRYVRPNLKRPDLVEAILYKNVLPVWAGRDARTIRPREVIDLLDGIVDRGAPVFANRTAQVIGQLFRFGIHRAIVEETPVKLLMRPGGAERPRQRVLTDEEIAAYLRDPLACTRYTRLAHVVTLLLYTGQRRGELVAAKWADVDLKAGIWRIPAEVAKTARESLVPLSARAITEFEQLKMSAEGSRWVLPTASGEDRHVYPQQFTTSLTRCARRFKHAGIEPFTLHDLRRTCRTGLARLKVLPHIAERVLGHAQERITATYDVHSYLDEKRAALEAWAAHLEQLRGARLES